MLITQISYFRVLSDTFVRYQLLSCVISYVRMLSSTFVCSCFRAYNGSYTFFIVNVLLSFKQRKLLHELLNVYLENNVSFCALLINKNNLFRLTGYGTLFLHHSSSVQPKRLKMKTGNCRCRYFNQILIKNPKGRTQRCLEP